MDWLQHHMVEAWAGLAVLLAVLELTSLDLVFAMCAAGAVIGVIAAIVGLPIFVQVLAASAAAVAMLALVRPNIVRQLHSGPELRLGHSALVGRTAIVVEEVSSQSGQIRIGGELWTARPYDDESVIGQGSTVDVLQIKGATALVQEVPRLGE
jgi:membrane protein implicated in regulation of membrane protease activity